MARGGAQMTGISIWLAALTIPLLLWHECGEDIGVFCYRIGLGAVTAVRSRTLAPVPVRNSIDSSSVRNNTECSTPSFIFSTRDRKSTRLNSSHSQISYAVFCLKKKKIIQLRLITLHINKVHSSRGHCQLGRTFSLTT